MNETNVKRKYEKRLTPKLLKEKAFIVQRLQKEWSAMESATSKEDMVRKVKAGAAALGKGIGWSLLAIALIAGACAIAVIAPNVVAAFNRGAKKGWKKTYFPQEKFKRELAYLKKRKYVNVINRCDGNEYEIKLTDVGERYMIQRVFGDIKMPVIEKWDGIWRIIIFDIPNKHKAEREGLRERLNSLGFYPLQESVFAYPHPCFDEIKFLTTIYDLNSYIRYIEAAVIIDDKNLKDFFNLKN